MTWMIYGAYGYTGKLMAQEAKAQSLKPILAGRNKEKVKKLAQELELPWAAFSLDDKKIIEKNLEAIKVLVNCAGPFSQTFSPMASACLKTKTHYLDITGEIEVFEKAQKLGSLAQEKKVLICPGAGFDVVPTDCLALKLKKLLPDAKFLALAFDGLKTTSAGTAKTAIEGLAQGAKIRENGKLKTIAFGSKIREIDFGNGRKLAMAIPWGDLSSAYFSTGIENIEVYTPVLKKRLKLIKSLEKFKPAFRFKFIQSFLKRLIEKKVAGPDTQRRSQEKGHVWGEVKNADGATVTGAIQTANGYDVAARAPVEMAKFLLEGKNVKYGLQTPATLMGEDFITTLPGSGEWRIEKS